MTKFWWKCNQYLSYAINTVLVLLLLALIVGFVIGMTMFIRS
jgi:hypothetical protein